VDLNCGLRDKELRELRWRQIDLLDKKQLTVGKSKTEAGTGRVIPLNDTVLAALRSHAGWYVKRFGECKPEWYVFPAGKGQPNDPTRPVRMTAAAMVCMVLMDERSPMPRMSPKREVLSFSPRQWILRPLWPARSQNAKKTVAAPNVKIYEIPAPTKPIFGKGPHPRTSAPHSTICTEEVTLRTTAGTNMSPVPRRMLARVLHIQIRMAPPKMILE